MPPNNNLDAPESKAINIEPLSLEGRFVHLKPLAIEQAPALWDVAKSDAEDIFRWIPYSMKSLDDTRAAVNKALAEQERGESVPFVTVERTQLENDESKATLAGDTSFVQKNFADDWTGGFSGGIWTTKESMLADAKDSANNKMNSDQISDLKVRTYGDTAIATYTDTYDGMVRGEHRVKTVLTTDTFVRQNGQWKQVASHSSVAKDK
jgi:hypothetical protein